MTRLRDGSGVVWYVRNGEILRVGNHSQGWSTAIVDVSVAYTEDIPRVQRVIGEVAEAMAEDDDWVEKIVEPPVVAGVESVTGNAVTIRVVVKCKVNEHFGVQRELRERIKAAFDRENIRVPAPVFPGATPATSARPESGQRLTGVPRPTTHWAGRVAHRQCTVRQHVTTTPRPLRECPAVLLSRRCTPFGGEGGVEGDRGAGEGGADGAVGFFAPSANSANSSARQAGHRRRVVRWTAGDALAGLEGHVGLGVDRSRRVCPPWSARWTATSRSRSSAPRRSAPRGWSRRWAPRRARPS